MNQRGHNEREIEIERGVEKTDRERDRKINPNLQNRSRDR